METLQTERCIISPLLKSDFKDIMAMYREPDSNRFIPHLLNKSNEEYRNFLDSKLKHNNHPRGLGFWVVRLLENQQFVGTVNLNMTDILGFIHIGAHLSSNFWSQGYATEVLIALRDYGLNTLKLPTIYSLCSEDHLASRKILDKIDFQYLQTIELRGEPVLLYKADRQ